jgi:hypothetical protein
LESYAGTILKLRNNGIKSVKITNADGGIGGTGDHKQFLLEVNDNKLYIEYRIDKFQKKTGEMGNTFNEFMKEYEERILKNIVNLHKEQELVDRYMETEFEQDLLKLLPGAKLTRPGSRNSSYTVMYGTTILQLDHELDEHHINFEEMREWLLKITVDCCKRDESSKL